MADTKISALNSLTKSTVATNDVLPIVDTGSTETKKITYQELIQPTDANFRIAGSSDTTKLVAFEVDGLTTATTRTLTVPDANTTIVGTDATQTLTNKTLTSPQINFGSDANGDLIYRNGSGVTARLAIGSTDQILAVQSGLPTWIANPSATAATSTTAGIVELATTAETETGTDATRAVTPDGLNDMTTLAGKAWFLDEDAMTSDSATKVPSQQSVKAYADSKLKYVPNSDETANAWYTWQAPIYYSLETGPAELPCGWDYSGISSSFTNDYRGGGGVALVHFTSDGYIYAGLPGNGSNNTYTAASSKDLRIKFRLRYDTAPSTGERFGFGIADGATELSTAETDTTGSIRFLNNAGTLYVTNANGSSYTATDISSGLTLTNWNVFEIVFNPGTDIKFYVNGTLKATHTTNLPTGTLAQFGFGYEYNATTQLQLYVCPTTISLEL